MNRKIKLAAVIGLLIVFGIGVAAFTMRAPTLPPCGDLLQSNSIGSCDLNKGN